ncbi:hypothetical protein [Photorhabdus australis]
MLPGISSFAVAMHLEIYWVYTLVFIRCYSFIMISCNYIVY